MWQSFGFVHFWNSFRQFLEQNMKRWIQCIVLRSFHGFTLLSKPRLHGHTGQQCRPSALNSDYVGCRFWQPSKWADRRHRMANKITLNNYSLFQPKYHGSSFLVASSYSKCYKDVANMLREKSGVSTRMLYDETAVVEFRLHAAVGPPWLPDNEHLYSPIAVEIKVKIK